MLRYVIVGSVNFGPDAMLVQNKFGNANIINWSFFFYQTTICLSLVDVLASDFEQSFKALKIIYL